MGFFSKLPPERKNEILGVVVLAVTVLLFLILATDGYQGESHRSISDLGEGGTMLAGLLYVSIGYAAHILYLLTGVWGIMLFRDRPIDRLWSRFLGAFALIVCAAGFIQLNFDQGNDPGGAIGAFVGYALQPKVGYAGATVVTLTFGAIGLLLSTDFLFIRMIHWLYSTTGLLVRTSEEITRGPRESMWARVEQRKTDKTKEKVITVTPGKERHIEWRSLFTSILFTKKSKVRRAVAAVRESRRENDTDDLSRIKVNTPEPTESAAPQALTPSEISQVEKRLEAHAEKAEEPVEVREAKQLEIIDDSPVYVSSGPAINRNGDAPLLRRKTTVEELPEDYEYPRFFTKPSVSMFEAATRVQRDDLEEALRAKGARLEETLATFGIEARVTDITRGPTITRFEVEPATGVKVSRFATVENDIALNLKAHGVRVEAPIPGRGKVGIEIPNDIRDEVVIRELLESNNFRGGSGQLTLAIGKDVGGDVVCADLATMPHLLVAGATGAGKTVCVKSILSSLLISKTPDELQLMLIDPKMVELSTFNDIPHLITPVVVDPKKAAAGLSWLINEMEERYRLFAQLGVRNIEVYNESVENGEIEVVNTDDDTTDSYAAIRRLPYIVCVIDELADLMMLARAEVEDAIARLAQLARAVGIHLIIATQRPSVDVLTGVIKANFPARISFQVASRIDSRTILDEMGAERLIGRGDMLYVPTGQTKPVRVQGAFVSDDEMHALIGYLKTQAPPQYRDEIESYGKQKEALHTLEDETDELFDDAVRVVRETDQASISMVQRRLRVGYTRAARLIDMMELRGIVGPHKGSKAREILTTVPPDDEDDEGEDDVKYGYGD